MTKADIVNSVSEATGLTKVETEAVLEGVLQSIATSLRKGERIDIRGIDTMIPPKKVSFFATSEAIIIIIEVINTLTRIWNIICNKVNIDLKTMFYKIKNI